MKSLEKKDSRRSLVDEAIDVIEKYMITDIQDISAFMSCDDADIRKCKLYSNKILLEIISNNKTKMKQGLKKKWYDNGSPAERVFLYKFQFTWF